MPEFTQLSPQPSPRQSPQSFPQILTAELEAIGEGRRLRAGHSAEATVVRTAERAAEREETPGAEPTWAQAVRRAHATRLAGLAFSGGGIRSATFNLGVVQGLARLGLLKRFDVLSTNSGGGYIGSWLTAWIRRAGIHAVEEQLDRGRREAEAASLRGDAGKAEEAEEAAEEAGRRSAAEDGAGTAGWREPEPLVWLRRFSNYLTPKVGFFTADSWTLVATYLRNLLLNLIVLVLALAALLLVPRAVVFASAWLQPRSVSWAGAVGFLLLGILFVACNLWIPSSESRVGDRQTYPWYTRQGWVQALVVLPLMLAAWLASSWMGTEKVSEVGLLVVRLGMDGWPVPMRWGGLALMLYLAAWLLGSLVHVGFAYWQQRRHAGLGGRSGEGWPEGPAAGKRTRLERGGLWFWLIAAALLSGIVGGLLLWSVIPLWLSSPEAQAAGEPGLRSPLHITVWGPPLIVGVFILTAVVHVGLMGRPFEERYRQWWSRLGAWLLIYSLGWLALFAIAFYGPLLILRFEGWARTALSLGWLVSTLGGVWVGRRTTAVTEVPRSWRRWMIALAPSIFVVGLLLLLALGLHWVLLAVTADSGVSMGAGFWPAPGAGLWEIGRSHTAAMWASIRELGGWNLGLPLLLLAGAVVLSHRVDINQFSMHLFYRNRLIRAYLGASNPGRRPQPFTGFDSGDDLPLARLSPRVAWRGRCYDGPYPILNAALNLV